MTEQDLDREHADLLLAEKRTSKRFEDAVRARTDTLNAFQKLCAPRRGSSSTTRAASPTSSATPR